MKSSFWKIITDKSINKNFKIMKRTQHKNNNQTQQTPFLIQPNNQ